MSLFVCLLCILQSIALTVPSPCLTLAEIEHLSDAATAYKFDRFDKKKLALHVITNPPAQKHIGFIECQCLCVQNLKCLYMVFGFIYLWEFEEPLSGVLTPHLFTQKGDRLGKHLYFIWSFSRHAVQQVSCDFFDNFLCNKSPIL